MGSGSSNSVPRSPVKAKPATATPYKAASLTTIRDASVSFGAGYGALLLPIERRIAQYLQRNCYTPLIGAVTPGPLHGTTSRALHDEVMAIRAPFHLVLMDLGEGDIMKDFLRNCIHVVSCSIFAPKITRIGHSFLRGCTFLSSFDTSGLASVTTIGHTFLGVRLRVSLVIGAHLVRIPMRGVRPRRQPRGQVDA